MKQYVMETMDVLLALSNYIGQFDDKSKRYKELTELFEKIANDKIILSKGE